MDLWPLLCAGAGLVLGHFLWPILFKQKSDARPLTTAGPPSDFAIVVFVRKDLKMRIGKIAAQVGHGSISLFFKVLKTNPAIAEAWAAASPTQKFYYCPDEETMDQIEATAKSCGYRTSVIHDAGRTQIAAGSATVLAIGRCRRTEFRSSCPHP
jgi:PTH2 family peptidyl-tRNA hydrolase